jgi:hypothetical protein
MIIIGKKLNKEAKKGGAIMFLEIETEIPLQFQYSIQRLGTLKISQSKNPQNNKNPVNFICTHDIGWRKNCNIWH